MSIDEIKEAGAFALYKAENAHRVEEMRKRADADTAIAADFDTYRSRYTNKFNDLSESLKEAGLTVTRAA